MRVCICAIAKHENKYINDWIRWHLSIGVDHIYIFDNNERNYPCLSFCIDKEFKDRVTILNLRHVQGVEHNPNVTAYYHFMDMYTGTCDWCAFIDIDEFINLVHYDNIKDWLSEAPGIIDSIAITWKIFGDDGVIDGDINVPVYERIKEDVGPKLDVNSVWLRYTFKSIVRCDNRLMPFGAHSFGKPVECIGVDGVTPIDLYDSNFNLIGDSDKIMDFSIDIESQSVYLNHYMTKTLGEFLRYKVNRMHRLDWPSVNDGLDYFFRINEKTDEKMEYIRSYALFNNIENFNLYVPDTVDKNFVDYVDSIVPGNS